MRATAASSLVVATVISAAICSAGQAVYLVHGGDLPMSARANGFRQETAATPGGLRVQVTTQLDPVGSMSEWSPDKVVRRAGGVPLPASLRGQLQPGMGDWAVASTVLEWVVATVVFDEDDAGPQDAHSVVRRGRGRCAGLANLSVALLHTAGFEARPVSGLLVGATGPVPHRWLECRFPGVGWVPSDPTLGLWVVTPHHIAYPAPLRRLPKVEVLEPGGRAIQARSRGDGWLVRENHGAELICHLVSNPDDDVMVVLSGPDGQRRSHWAREVTRFESLLPGRWELTVEIGGRCIVDQHVELRGGQVHSIAIDLTGENRSPS
jgi:hypothetical protein